MSPLRLHTLGSLRLLGAEGDLLPSRRRELALLCFLAYRAPATASRAELATLFWGDRPEERARHSLRQALLELRRANPNLLEVLPDVVRLQPGMLEWDVRAFEAEVAAGQLANAVEHWKGDFLLAADEIGGEEFRFWADAERARLRRLLAATLERLVMEADTRGAWTEAAQWTRRWTELLPLDSTAQLRRVEMLQRAGRTDEARAHHAAWTLRLRQELGAEPTAEWLRLGGQLARERPRPAVPATLPGSAALFSPDLIGREAAFRLLTDAWDAVRGEHGGAVWIEGEDGLGKTRLCRDFAGWVEQAGEDPVVLRAELSELDRDRTWSALREMLRGLATAPGLGSVPDSALAEVAALVPQIRERFPRLPDPSGDPHALTDAVTRTLADVAYETPTLVVADGFALADPASQHLLLTLVRRPPPGVLLVVASRGPAPDAVASLPRRIRLPPLTPLETERLVASMLMLSPTECEHLAEHVHAASGGNPAYAVQTVSALADEGHLRLLPDGSWQIARLPAATDALRMPRGIRNIVQRRLAKLSEPGRRVLEAAAFTPLGIDAATLQCATSLAADVVTLAVEELLAARFLRERTGRPVGYLLTNELVREVVRERVSPERRAVLEQALVPGTHAAAGAHHSVVAVFPFAVHGEGEVGFLVEGMVDLLSTSLDGAGEVRSVDPRALLSQLGALVGGPVDVERARTLARQFGAHFFLLGSVLGTADQVRILATVHPVEAGAGETKQATVDGPVQRLFELVDELAARFLATWSPRPTARLASTTARTTRSLPAVKAYLEGQSAMRAGRFAAGMDCFRSAVQLDPGFALAHYRLALASNWNFATAEGRVALDEAKRQSAHLPERDRLLIAALDPLLRGNPAEAERRYRGIVGRYPDEVEAWYQLGETLFHHNPVIGRSMTEARGPFERVLALDPDDGETLAHLVALAAVEDRHDDLEILYRQIQPRESVPLPWQAMRAFAVADRGAQARVRAMLHDASDLVLLMSVRYVATLARDLRAARSLTELITAPTRAPATRAYGFILRAHLELALGRWDAARESLAAAATLDPDLALEHHALLAAAPFTPVTPSELEQLLDALTRWAPQTEAVDEPGSVGQFTVPYRALRPLLRHYLLGQLAARQGDTTALDAAAALELQPEPFAQALAASVRARLLWQQGRPDEALPRLEQHWPVADVEHVYWSPFFGRPLERYLRAELLRQCGRAQEALQWYTSLSEFLAYDVPFLAPAHHRRAELQERLNNRERAAHHYTQFVNLWKEGDPALQAQVDQARRHLQPPVLGARRRWPRLPGLTATVLVLAVGAATLFTVFRSGRSAAPPAVIAVGTVHDFTGGDTAAALHALPEMLATNLARVPGLMVVSNARIQELIAQDPASRGNALAPAARRAGAGELLTASVYQRARRSTPAGSPTGRRARRGHPRRLYPPGPRRIRAGG